MPASNVTVTATFKEEAPKTIDLSQVSIATDTFGNDWEVTFKGGEETCRFCFKHGYAIVFFVW